MKDGHEGHFKYSNTGIQKSQALLYVGIIVSQDGSHARMPGTYPTPSDVQMYRIALHALHESY